MAKGKSKSPMVEVKEKKKRTLTKWNIFLAKHYHDKDVLAKPARERFKAVAAKYCASNKKSMSTCIALDKIIAKLGFLHVVESYDDRQSLKFLFLLLEIDTLRDVTLSELQKRYKKNILAMVPLERQQKLFDLASQFEREIM